MKNSFSVSYYSARGRIFFVGIFTAIMAYQLFIDWNSNRPTDLTKLTLFSFFGLLLMIFLLSRRKVNFTRSPFRITETVFWSQKQVFIYEDQQNFFIDLNEATSVVEVFSKSNDEKKILCRILLMTSTAAARLRLKIINFYNPQFKIEFPEKYKSITSQTKLSYITYILIIINVLVAIVFRDSEFSKMTLALAKDSLVHKNYWQLFTYSFVHANTIHLVFNMLALLSLGKDLESYWGRTKMLSIYLISGLGAGLWALLWIHGNFLVGASGAIFGLFGAIAYLTYKKVFVSERGSSLKKDLFLNLVISLLPGISLAAHFGGFVVGWMMATFIYKSESLSFWRR